jgi:hypothetical protein
MTRARSAPTASTTGNAGGRWRGVLSNASQCFGPDGRRKRYKVIGRTKQDVIEALKKKSDLDAGLSTSRSYNVEMASLNKAAGSLW